MRFAICNEIYQGWTLEATFEHAHRTGYDAVEIAPFTVARRVTEVGALERGRIRELAARSGMAVSGIHWVLAQTEGLHLTHPEAAVRERTARYLTELVDFGADVGGAFMVVGSPKQRSRMEGVTVDQAWDWAQGSFREAVTRAEDRGVTICIEPLAPAETNFLNTAAEAVRFARGFESPAMKIILDVKAMCAEEKPIPTIIRETGPDFAYFHANDRNLKGPGFGDVDFVPIAAALREVGYAGYVSVEVFQFEEGADAIATRSLDYLKRSFALPPGRV